MKKEYFKKFEMLLEQGLLNNDSDKTKELIQELKKFSEVNQQKIQEHNDNILVSLFAEGLHWDGLMRLDVINVCNSVIKCSIRDKYYDMADNYLSSILQRKISLNAKKLAIKNYMKQIQEKSSEFSPYEIEFRLNSEDYLGRNCDKVYQQRRLRNKKRN